MKPEAWLENIINVGWRAGANHIHVIASRPCIYRKLGWIVPKDSLETVFTPEKNQIRDLALALGYPQVRTLSCDKSGDWRAIIRFSSPAYIGLVEQSKGDHISMQIQLYPHTPPEMEALGMRDLKTLLVKESRGIVLIGGPRQSGRTTTAASMLIALGRSRSHIGLSAATIEKYTEYVLSGEVLTGRVDFPANLLQFEADTRDSWLRCLEEALSGDFDVVQIGDLFLYLMADETALEYVIQLASQKLVIATVPAMRFSEAFNRAIGFSNDRLTSRFAPKLAPLVRAIVLQQLITTKRQSSFEPTTFVSAALSMAVGTENHGMLVNTTSIIPYNQAKVDRALDIAGASALEAATGKLPGHIKNLVVLGS